jgi:hypothetical protein
MDGAAAFGSEAHYIAGVEAVAIVMGGAVAADGGASCSEAFRGRSW